MESRMFFSVAQLSFQFQDISLQNTLPTTISSVAFPPKKGGSVALFSNHRQLLVLGGWRLRGLPKAWFLLWVN